MYSSCRQQVSRHHYSQPPGSASRSRRLCGDQVRGFAAIALSSKHAAQNYLTCLRKLDRYHVEVDADCVTGGTLIRCGLRYVRILSYIAQNAPSRDYSGRAGLQCEAY
jgi:hypothetical protein